MSLRKRYGLVLLLSWGGVHRPATAQNTFYAQYEVAAHDHRLTPSLDNAFYGTTSAGSYSDTLYYYKVDQEGNMLWMRKAPLGETVIPIAIVSLSDNSFAILAFKFTEPYSLVYKISDAGELLWGKSLDLASAATFQAVAPTTDGGLMLTGSGCLGADMILHLDADGQILSQHGHASYDSQYYHPNAMDMVHDGDNHYSYMGYATDQSSDYAPLAFFRSDSAGTVTSFREIHFAPGTSHSWSMGTSIVRSTSGGHYIAVMVNDTAMDHVVMLYLNAQDELQWVKDIATPDERLMFSAVSATVDGGCVISGSNVLTLAPYLYNAYAIKFNEQGTMLWSRMAGDITESGWDHLGVQDLVPASDGEFIVVPVHAGGIHLCRVDAAFNGYCNDQPFTPIVTDLSANVLPYTLTPTGLNFVGDDLLFEPVPTTCTRTNLCAYSSVPEEPEAAALTLAPNPASDQVQLYPGIHRPGPVVILLRNNLGALCACQRYMAIPDAPLMVRTSGLPSGTYTVEVRTEEGARQALLVVQR